MLLVNIDFSIDVALVRKARFFGELSFLGFSNKTSAKLRFFQFFFFFFFFLIIPDIMSPETWFLLHSLRPRIGLYTVLWDAARHFQLAFWPLCSLTT